MTPAQRPQIEENIYEIPDSEEEPSDKELGLRGRRSPRRAPKRGPRDVRYISVGTSAVSARKSGQTLEKFHQSKSISRHNMTTHGSKGSAHKELVAINLHSLSDAELYRYVQSRLEDLRELYISRGENPDAFNDKRPIQWPYPHKGGGKVRLLCTCRMGIENPQAQRGMVRCFDPACEVPGGWYHLTCLSTEDKRNRAAQAEFICSACVLRRVFEDFPEFESPSLVNDSRERFTRMVAIWGRGQVTAEEEH